jgi:hypothetical protein
LPGKEPITCRFSNNDSPISQTILMGGGRRKGCGATGFDLAKIALKPAAMATLIRGRLIGSPTISCGSDEPAYHRWVRSVRICFLRAGVFSPNVREGLIAGRARFLSVAITRKDYQTWSAAAILTVYFASWWLKRDIGGALRIKVERARSGRLQRADPASRGAKLSKTVGGLRR